MNSTSLIVCKGGVPPSWVVAKKLIQDGVAGIIIPSFAINASPIEG